MSNFLNDYIRFRGANTVLKSQYGIVDVDTGEHLVPVQHANEYFGSDIINIITKPNAGKPIRENPPIDDFFLMDENGIYMTDENDERLETWHN